MPLSEHEQRVLEQMEHAMETEDPKFATAMRGRTSQARQRRRFLLGGTGVVVGLILVVLGVARAAVPLAVVGFVLMIAAGALIATPPRGARSTGGQAASPLGAVGPDGRTRPRRARNRARRAGHPAAQPRSGTFMQRLEQRWNRRRDEGRGWNG